MIKPAIRLLAKAGWAPVAVLIFHNIIAGTSWRNPLDFWMHFLGGMAIAFFLYCAIREFPRILGTASRFGHYLYAFALALSVGVFWEFGEMFSDSYFHTHIQFTVRETMSDLIADATGALDSLAVVFVISRFWTRSAINGVGRHERP